MRKEIYIIAHNIRSLYNVGSIFRSADGFGVEKVYLTGYTAAPDDIIRSNGETARQKKQISKTALGADELVEWEHVRDAEELIKNLKKQGISVYALETGENTVDIHEFKPKFPSAIIVGNEASGIEPKVLRLVDKILSIPMKGQKESFNVSVATGVVLYEFDNKRKN